MGDNKPVSLLRRHPQLSIPTEEKIVTLSLDHLSSSGNNGGCNQEELYGKFCFETMPGAKVSFVINNEVSKEEKELHKFCREQMKKKNFEGIVARAAEVLKEHPSSIWGHFFYGASCKKIPGKEHAFVASLAHAVSINPNFLCGWQALHNHFLSAGGFFSETYHDEMCVVVKVLLHLDPSFENWCTLVGQIWHYVVTNSFKEYRILKLISPYLLCDCPQRKEIAAQVFINFIRTKNMLLSSDFSDDVLKSFQILLLSKTEQNYRLGVFHAAIRCFNRTNDLKQICDLVYFLYENDVLEWSSMNAKEFAYHLIYEIFKCLGPEAWETILILKNACGEDILSNKRYFLCRAILKLTNSYTEVIENYNGRFDQEIIWGKILYLKVMTDLKLYQEAYEQVLIDLFCGLDNAHLQKDYFKILIEIFSRAKDLSLNKFTLKLAYTYLEMYGLDVGVLHNMCFACISLSDFVTAKEICKCLCSLGALKDVIYLQSILEEEADVKLDYLKALDGVPAASLLSAVVYNNLGKSKRVIKSMLEASFHFHVGITPFEWLGIHYFERDLQVKSTRYFLEAYSNYLVSCVSVDYISSIYSKHGDSSKIRLFFESLNSRCAITMDVARKANLKSGLNYMIKPEDTTDYHRALEKFRRVTDLSFEREHIELVADSLSKFGMHGSSSDFYLMCHAESDKFFVHPAVMYGTETKMIKRKGHIYLSTTRSVAAKAPNSPLALYTHGCAVFDRALASYNVKNYRHCIFLCQQSLLLLSRCTALYANSSSFWSTLGNILFTVASLHSEFSSIYVPTWLFSKNNKTETMVPVNKREAFVAALRCYTIALKVCKNEDIKKLIFFYIGVSFRYAKLFYKEIGDRMLRWALHYALESCDFTNWHYNNLCGVLLTGLEDFENALTFFKDAMAVGAKEAARDAEFNLGVVYLRLCEFNKAHEVFMFRRGSDPMDSLVWRSYILLHLCLDDKETVLHYLWYLIYCIKHYPSLQQGMEYLKFLSESNLQSENITKKCLMYTVFRSPMFMKMSFIGDCEVPHKLNGVTALDYFHHGEYYAALGRPEPARENFFNFLKLASQNTEKHEQEIEKAMFALTENPPSTENNLQAELNKHLKFLQSDSEDVISSLLRSFESSNPLNLPKNGKKLYFDFVSRNLIRHLLKIPSTKCRFSPPVYNKDILDGIADNIFALLNPKESDQTFLSRSSFISLMEDALQNVVQF